MKRGTMMVLKRFLVTALGALGLTALAAGTAVAQQIPAPKLYSDISECAPTTAQAPANATGRRNNRADPSWLDTVLAVREAAGTRPDLTGADLTAADSTLFADAAAAEEALNTFSATYRGGGCAAGNPIRQGIFDAESIASRVSAFGPATEGAAPINPELYQQALADQALISGDIYDAVAAQQAQLNAVNDAVQAYNEFLGAAATSSTIPVVYSTAWSTYGAISVTGFDDGNTANGNPYGGSSAINGFQQFSVSADTGLLVTVGSMGANNGVAQAGFTLDIDNDATADITADLTTFAGIESGLRQANSYLMNLQDTLATARQGEADSSNIADLNSRIATAQRVVNHFNTELARLQGVALNSQSTSQTAAANRTALTNFSRANSHAATLEQAVRASVTALQNARDGINDGLQDPDSYLEQLVALRTYQKAQADAGGVDAIIEDAQEALMMAQSQLMQHRALAGADDGNPAVALLNSLLEPPMAMGRANPADDDGQALLDAISANYNNIVEVAQNIQDVEDLAGPVAANTEKNAQQDMRLDDHEMRISTNETMLMDHETRISTNASEIMRVEGRVDSNWDAIAENQTAIGMNTSAIGMNTSAIADNASAIGRNSGAISDNRNMIGELSDNLEVVRAGVAASMALAGMPAINGRGVSIGVGSFDGESAFAVGFQIQGEMASFKVGVTSGGGATGASAGVGFQF